MTVKLKNLNIGEGTPKICVPVMGKTKTEILASAKAAAKAQPAVQLAEWRADDFDDVFLEGAAEDIVGELCDVLAPMPLLVTFRTKAEGGKKEASPESYFDFLCRMIKLKKADMLDIELKSGNIEPIVKAAKAAGIKVILSNHDFEKTPGNEEILARLLQMEKAGADIAKIAVMPENMEDVLRLLSCTLKAKEMLSCPVVTMSMGREGLISRLCGEQFGSAVTFGTVGEASAPGQIEAKVLSGVLELFKK